MSVSNELQVAEEAVVRALRATRAVDAESGPMRHSQQTDNCPPVARFAAVLKFGGAWSAEEAKHLRGCAFCQKVFAMFAAATETVGEDTVVNLDTSEETHTGLSKPKGGKPKPG